MQPYIDSLSAIPLLDVFAAAMAMFLLSSLWYGALFHKLYVRLSGKTEAETKPCTGTMVKGFVVFTLTCLLIGLIDVHAKGNPVAIFASLGLIWLFIALDTVHATIWDKMPFRLFLIYTGNSFANLMVAGLVFWLIE